MSDDLKAYADNIAQEAGAQTQHAIENMTPQRAISILEEGIEIMRDAPDPEGNNLGVEIRMLQVEEWLKRMASDEYFVKHYHEQ